MVFLGVVSSVGPVLFSRKLERFGSPVIFDLSGAFNTCIRKNYKFFIGLIMDIILKFMVFLFIMMNLRNIEL